MTPMASRFKIWAPILEEGGGSHKAKQARKSNLGSKMVRWWKIKKKGVVTKKTKKKPIQENKHTAGSTYLSKAILGQIGQRWGDHRQKKIKIGFKHNGRDGGD